ncbi:MAG: nitrogenase component 1 [Lachnospiraceae bacterium]|nr:nitrogenase component 1 [Lachnospiraceae bacterium]
MLEYNMPVHEGWNIVNIAMQVPESHQIYVCPENCARGVIMTAHEMGAADRISCVTVSERDLIVDNLETVTIEGVSDVVSELAEKPAVIFLFTVCSHRILSCDFSYVFRALRKRFPEIIWAHGYMDCIAQKEGPAPDVKLRRAMYDFVPKSETSEKTVNLLGIEVRATAENNDIVAFYEKNGYRVRQLSDIHRFDEYMKLGDACLNICMHKPGDEAVRQFSERLGIPYVFVLPFFDEKTVSEWWKRTDLSQAPEKELTYEEVAGRYRAFQEEIGDSPVVIDSMAITCPYSLAYFLLENGFNVQAVVSDGPAEYESDIYGRLMKKYPSLLTVKPTDPRLREKSYRDSLIEKAVETCRQTETDGNDTVTETPASVRILAIGPMAAWIYATPYFVNQIENDGAFGCLGMNALLEKMQDAFWASKDMPHTVSRKALGCACVQ